MEGTNQNGFFAGVRLRRRRFNRNNFNTINNEQRKRNGRQRDAITTNFGQVSKTRIHNQDIRRELPAILDVSSRQRQVRFTHKLESQRGRRGIVQPSRS